MGKGAGKQSAKMDVTNNVIEGNNNSDHSSGLTIFSFHGSETISIVAITIVVILALLFLCFIYNRTRALCWLCLHRNLSQKQKIKAMGKDLHTVNTIDPMNSIEASIDNQLTSKKMESAFDTKTINNVIQLMNMLKQAESIK